MPADAEPPTTQSASALWDDSAEPSARAVDGGLRFGPRGVHGSRTIMLSDLTALFAGVPPGADTAGYVRAILEENVFDGARWNDLHYTRAAKENARGSQSDDA